MTQIRHTLTIRLRQPAVVGDGLLRGQLRSSRAWIPGETILGALAGAALRDHDPKSADLPTGFRSMFRDGRFGPGLAVGHQRRSLSTAVCKYDSKERCWTTAVDLAFADDHGLQGRTCPSCKGPLTMAKGEIRSIGNGRSFAMAQRTHVELTENEQAKEGQLFRREVLPPSHWVAGAWFDEPITRTERIRLGGASTTHGGAMIDIVPDDGEPDIASVVGHLDATSRLIVRFDSPAALVDPWGRPAAVASDWAWQLEEAFPAAGARIVRQWVRWDTTGGWQSGGLPKPTERCVAAGSVAEIAFDTSPTTERLVDFRNAGLGLRTQHGLGWISLVPPPQAETAVAS